jgi:hypothetical protein
VKNEEERCWSSASAFTRLRFTRSGRHFPRFKDSFKFLRNLLGQNNTLLDYFAGLIATTGCELRAGFARCLAGDQTWTHKRPIASNHRVPTPESRLGAGSRIRFASQVAEHLLSALMRPDAAHPSTTSAGIRPCLRQPSLHRCVLRPTK